MLNILLPSLPYQRVLDPMWQAEADEARRLGHTVCLYDADQHRLYQQPVPTQPTLYRGWMLNEHEYARLASLTPLLVSADLYHASHQATGWYEAIAPFTIPSSFTRAYIAALPVTALLHANGRCFVKGLTKSFGAASVVGSENDLLTLLQQEAITGDELLFVRAFVDLADRAEERYFAVQGEVYGAAGRVFPAALQPAIDQLHTRWFYTIDVAYTRQGQPLIIEVGDGQVSDTKEWTLTELYEKVIPRLPNGLRVPNFPGWLLRIQPFSYSALARLRVVLDDEAFCWDVIPEWERSFSIRFAPDDFAQAATVGDVWAVVEKRLLAHGPLASTTSCTSQRTFYRLRQALTSLGQVRADITLLLNGRKVVSAR